MKKREQNKYSYPLNCQNINYKGNNDLNIRF